MAEASVTGPANLQAAVARAIADSLDIREVWDGVADACSR
jgi:hypothetical protein